MKGLNQYILETQTPRAMNLAYRSLNTFNEALVMLESIKCWDNSINSKLRPHISALYKIKDELETLIDEEKNLQGLNRELRKQKK